MTGALGFEGGAKALHWATAEERTKNILVLL